MSVKIPLSFIKHLALTSVEMISAFPEFEGTLTDWQRANISQRLGEFDESEIEPNGIRPEGTNRLPLRNILSNNGSITFTVL